MTVRLHQFKPGPEAEAIVATARTTLGDAEERRPTPRDVFLVAEPREPRLARANLISDLERLHPRWRDLVSMWIDGQPSS